MCSFPWFKICWPCLYLQTRLHWEELRVRYLSFVFAYFLGKTGMSNRSLHFEKVFPKEFFVDSKSLYFPTECKLNCWIFSLNLKNFQYMMHAIQTHATMVIAPTQNLEISTVHVLYIGVVNDVKKVSIDFLLSHQIISLFIVRLIKSVKDY